MAPDLVRVVVADVAVAVPAGMGVEAGQVTLAELDVPYRRISMFIGQPEARAIRTAWRNEVPPRPTTWDLFVSTVSLLGGRVERAVIDDVEEARHFFAQISLRRHDGERLVITARPSDAIALALRSDGARILCRSEVLDAAGFLGNGPPGLTARDLIAAATEDRDEPPSAAVPPPLEPDDEGAPSTSSPMSPSPVDTPTPAPEDSGGSPLQGGESLAPEPAPEGLPASASRPEGSDGPVPAPEGSDGPVPAPEEPDAPPAELSDAAGVVEPPDAAAVAQPPDAAAPAAAPPPDRAVGQR